MIMVKYAKLNKNGIKENRKRGENIFVATFLNELAWLLNGVPVDLMDFM